MNNPPVMSGASPMIAHHVGLRGLHIAHQQTSIGQWLGNEGESACAHEQQFRGEEMTQLMQEYTGQEYKRKYPQCQSGMARGEEQDGLYLTMQKPLEINQRQQHQDKPE